MAAQGYGLDDKVSLSGDTMSGTLVLEGTPPLAIPAGAAIGKVVTSDAAGNLSLEEPAAPVVIGLAPSGDETGTADLANIQALLDVAGTTPLQAGAFWAAEALNYPGNGGQLEGAGADATEISQTSSSQHGITSSITTGLYDIAVRKLTVNGPGAASTSYHGVYFDAASGNIESLDISSARIQYFGDDGIHLTGPINSLIAKTIVQHTGNNGISVVDGTSTGCDTCYVRSQAGIGYSYNGTAYSSLTNCACDFGEIGYQFSGVNSLTASGCGCEAQTTGGFKVTGGSVGVVLDGCYCLSNPGIACWVTGDSTATIIGFREISPAGGATASIQVDAGSSATVIDPVYVTPPNYQGNVTEIRNGVVTYWSGGSRVLSPATSIAPAGAIAQTISPVQIGTSAIPLGSGDMFVHAIELPAGVPVSDITYLIGATAGATVTHAWYALLNSSFLQVGHTADQTSGSLAADTLVTKPLVTPYTPSATAQYWLGIVVVAGTQPTLGGFSTPQGAAGFAAIPVAGASTTALTGPGTDGVTSYAAPTAVADSAYAYAS